MTTTAQWVERLRSMVATVRRDPPSIGVLSMGERCAVALVIDKETLDGPDGVTVMRPRTYTWLDCANRLEPELFEACVSLQRELGIS